MSTSDSDTGGAQPGYGSVCVADVAVGGSDPSQGQHGYGQPDYGQQAGRDSRATAAGLRAAGLRPARVRPAAPGYAAPGYAAPGYGPPPGYAPQWPRPTNTMAILALVMAFVFAPAGLILGIVARRQIRQTGEQGDGLALAGIIIGGIFTALFVLMILFMVVAFAGAASFTY